MKKSVFFVFAVVAMSISAQASLGEGPESAVVCLKAKNPSDLVILTSENDVVKKVESAKVVDVQVDYENKNSFISAISKSSSFLGAPSTFDNRSGQYIGDCDTGSVQITEVEAGSYEMTTPHLGGDIRETAECGSQQSIRTKKPVMLEQVECPIGRAIEE